MDISSKIFVAGHMGLVGSALVRQLKKNNYHNLVLATHDELDLTNQEMVNGFFFKHQPKYVFLAAAKVGGILANNTYRADFIYQNLAIEINVIEASRRYQVERLLFLGSSCIYPRNCRQPIKESDLLSGYLESTNEPYAIAKIAGIKMCEAYNAQYQTNFTSLMPTNLYGPHDNFDLKCSHVLPALIYKIHHAKLKGEKSVTVWGTGSPMREFLYVEDLADACLFVMNNSREHSILNVGSGEEVSIKELAELMSDIIGYKGRLVFDTNKPDGTPRKFLDSSKINTFGWRAQTSLKDGIVKTYQWFLTSCYSGLEEAYAI